MLCLASRDKGRPDVVCVAARLGKPAGHAEATRLAAAAIQPFPGQPPSVPTYEDEQLRRMLVGTWGHQDTDSIHYITLGGDGSMRATMQWKDQFKQMFHQDVRSSGTWKVAGRRGDRQHHEVDRQGTPRPGRLVPRALDQRQRAGGRRLQRPGAAGVEGAVSTGCPH